MRLDRLLDGVTVLAVAPDADEVEVTGVAFDSRAVTGGDLFFCVPGSTVDGHDFAAAAAAAGASALLVERTVDVELPQVVVPSVRTAMAPISAAYYGHPSKALTVVGITGTNGKTTTAHLVGAIFEAHGWPTGVMGTLSGVRTTPEAPDLQRQLAELRDQGKVAVAMEVSSEGLAQHRADSVHFSVAVFTNLSQDHLNFHRSMDAYFEAKAILFDPAASAAAAIWADDPWGRRLLERRPDARPFSMADAANLRIRREGSAFEWRGVEVELPLPGRFNVANALGAATAAELVGVPPAAVAAGLARAGSVPGRFEQVAQDLPFSVIVDYAHTPDALEEVLAAARELAAADGRLIVVFGCGGDRDAAKRPLMGEVATRLADIAYLTSDNPRSEDPAAIMAEVVSGVEHRDRLNEEPDRAAAIRAAVKGASAGDVVVIAGKGHEQGQERDGVVTPFDDREVARGALGGR